MKKSKEQIEYEKKFNRISKILYGDNSKPEGNNSEEYKKEIASKTKNEKSNTVHEEKKKGNKNKPKNLKELMSQIDKKDKEGKHIKQELKIHKCFDSYLCKLEIKKNNYIDNNISTTPNTLKMFIILDISGSMNEQVKRFIQQIIPDILNKIYGKETSYSVCLITFQNEVNVYEGDSNFISNLTQIDAFGGTDMSLAVKKLYDMISNKEFENKIYRILTLSDGELHDQEDTMQAADNLKKLLIKENITVNSQSIRLFTNTFDEPDTRGLSSMLQLSTTGKQMLIDIDCNTSKNDEISKLISDLFINDGLGDSFVLKNDLNENCLQEEPWSTPKNSIYLFPGNNSFWINLKNDKVDICNYIKKNFKLLSKNGQNYNIKCTINDDVSIDNYQNLIKDKIDFYFKQLKVFKVVNTEESLKKMDKIIEFFNNLENNIFSKDMQPKDPKQFKLYERTQAIKSIIKRRKLSLTNRMREIRNDDKINQLNSRQQAEYLRAIDINDKTGKSLARRALGGEIDFDEIVRKEMKQMAIHIKELDSVDESKLTTSFYSTCNTLDGIKAVCKLYHDAKKDNIFDEITANDVLKLINIVGVAANATIGNYPDPMTYRIKSLYPGTFISLSDILIAYEVTGGKNLKEIGTQNEIITSIPYFEDEKIGNFLMKYCPKLLEYSASIGMRRILAEIPYTNEYTILAGLWGMIPLLLKDKKEIYIKIFVELCKSYLISVGNHFKYVSELLENQKEMDKDGLSIYIANNGITNMISPILRYLKDNKNKNTDDIIKRIVRATYQFEVYQFTKKNIKLQKTDDPDNYVKSVLLDLLKINLEKNKTIVTELFQENTKDPIFYDKYEINDAKFNEIMSIIWWADYIIITPLFLKASLAKDPVSEFKNIEINNITEEIMQERLGINFNSKLFKLYCIVQAYLQHEQADRIDLESKKMKIIDLGIKDKAEKYIKDFIQNLFREKYEIELKVKAKKEKEIISQELVNKIVDANSISEFNSLLKNGIKKGVIEYKLLDHASLGFEDIIKKFGDKNKNIKFRKEKINILLTGKDDKENQIWNENNKIRSFKLYYPLKYVLEKEEWDNLIKKMKKRGIHIYRDNKNRQGHDNKHLSYWAIGFNSIQEMMSCVSKEDFDKYAKEHANCCGFYNGKYCIMRRHEKGIGVTKKRKEKNKAKNQENSQENEIKSFGRGGRGSRGGFNRLMRFRRRYKRGKIK